MRAIQVRQFGGPEVLVPAVVSDPVPHHDELLVRVSGAGVNYADTHQAENTYLSSSSLPFVPGGEVVGDVVDPGGLPRRVCGFVSRGGGYAELAVVRKGLAFDVPASVTDTQALSLLVQGLTAWHLVRTCARVAPGETVVVHAAAGGVGNLAVQLAKAAGAGRVIATASTQDKLDLAADLGADVGVLLDGSLNAHDVKTRLVEANGHSPVDVVFEMVGGTSFDGSLSALAPFGRIVTFGMASRVQPAPVHPTSLMIGSHSIVGFWLMDCLRPDRIPSMVAAPMAELMAMVADGRLRPLEGHVYPLERARAAHEAMRERRTTGKVVLAPHLDEHRS
ncbi:MAG: zinc-binding dehydrogenase [Frankiales bacterium]|nr:zinc-binding dehydrogenase [Frankiales bacterium]